MTGGKGRKTIDKVLEVRRQEENQAALEAAARGAEVERAQENLAAAEEELEAITAKVRAVSSTLRRRLAKGAKGTELAMAQAHAEAGRTDLEKAGTRVSELKTTLGQARMALNGAMEKLKQKSADKRVAEKYVGRLVRKERKEREKKEENED